MRLHRPITSFFRGWCFCGHVAPPEAFNKPSPPLPAPPEGDEVLLEKSSSYLPAALWNSRVLWVVALLFAASPWSLALIPHGSCLRPRIALKKKPPPPPPLSSSSSTPLFSLYWIPPPYYLSLHPSLPLFPWFEGAVRGHPLFSPSWVCWHTVNLRSLSPLPPLFLLSPPSHRLCPPLSLNSKAATAVDCISIASEEQRGGGGGGVAKYIVAITYCLAVDSFKTFQLLSVQREWREKDAAMISV